MDFSSKTTKMASLADYQQNAVVSREIIKKDAGTVTVFAFDGGEGLSEHTAPFDALVYIVDGRAEIRIAADTFALETGDMIVLPAGKPHALIALTQFKMLLIMIKS